MHQENIKYRVVVFIIATTITQWFLKYKKKINILHENLRPPHSEHPFLLSFFFISLYRICFFLFYCFFINQAITTQKSTIYLYLYVVNVPVCVIQSLHWLYLWVGSFQDTNTHIWLQTLKLLLRLCFSLSLFENDWTVELRHGVRGFQTQGCPQEEQFFGLGLCFSWNIVDKPPSSLFFYF